MRILVDLQACQSASRRRGIGRYSLALADALVAAATAHEVSLLVNAAFPDAVDAICAHFAATVPRERIHTFATPVPVAAIDAANQCRSRMAEPIREAVVVSLRPDAVLVSSLFEGFVDDATTSLAKSTPSLRAVTLYDLIPLVRDDVLGSPEARAWYERKLAFLRQADLLLAISRHARDEAIAALGVPDADIAVICASVDPAFCPATDGKDTERELRRRFVIDGGYVLYSGGFDSRKNVGRLIDAYARLPESMRARSQLVLAGQVDERERRRLALIASRAGLRPRDCAWTGYVTDAELATLYRACTAFAFPSLHEGFGLPVLEAMACGAAVIASNATSIPEVVGRSDALFDPTDTASIADRLERVLRDDAFRGVLREHGLARATDFSWAATARRTLDAIEDAFQRKRAKARAASSPRKARPSLAFVSPLPPERTGIAAFSAELLAPLRTHYEIDIVADQPNVDLPPDLADLPARTSDWFAANAERYDRVLYQMGNSPFHHRMFALLERHPGVVVLHDVHLGGVLGWMEMSGVAPGIFVRSLLESHGYAALAYAQAAGRDAAIDRYPCSLRVIDDADGIVVHSEHALDVARAAFRIAPEDWRTIPQLRRLPDLGDRDAARRALRLRPDDVLFASFGFLAATKLDHRILDAWLASPLAADPRCVLAFVGENHGGEYGRGLAARIAAAGSRISITGFVDAATFEHYLVAADAAIQLRGVSRGETSRSALDCLAHGLPLVANASGSLAELPGEVLLRIPADFTDAELVESLARLASDREMRERLGKCARRYIAERHDPVRVAEALRDALENFAAQGPQQRHRQVVSAVAHAAAGVALTRDDDWRSAAQAIAVNRRRSRPRQMFIDVTVLAKQDLRSGIERVARSVLRELLEQPPAGCLVEPVVASTGCYRYARSFTCKWLGLPPVPLPDAPIDTAPGDVFFGLDWAADVVPSQEAVLARYRTLGVHMAFLIHDLLPIRAPHFYPPGIDAMHSAWLHSVARVADGVFCVSNAVAEDFVAWLNEQGPERASALGIDILSPAADIEHSVPSKGVPRDADALVAQISARPGLLMVGTVEPRKGHAQAVAACEALWRAGDDIGLVIVGRQGWLVDELSERLRRHPEAGRRLFWFENASDEWLEALYANASVLLAPSHGEGFGLPLVEAARRGMPLLVRDLPVFREVAAEHATYFTGNDAEELALAIRRWQDARARGALPDSSRIPERRWRQSVDHASRVMLADRWRRQWRSSDATAVGAAQRARFDVDFSRTALSSVVQAIEGLSGHENWGRWSDANLRRSVEIRFRGPIPVRGTVTLTARAFGPNAGQPVRLRIGGHEAELRFGAHETTASETYAVHEPSQIVEIEPPHPTRPSDLAASHDNRRLGIGLVRLTIVAA